MTASLGYRAIGPADAPTVVLGSSLGTDKRMWEPQLDALTSAGYRVVLYDHRGHGESEVPLGPYTIADLAGDVVGLLDHLGIERCHVGGLSLGGMVAMWLGAHVPDRVTSLSLFCTSAYMPPAQNWLDRAAKVREGGTAVVAEAVVARWFTPAFAQERPDVVAGARAMMESIDASGYAACCEAIAAMDLRPVLDRVTAPTLVVAGEADLAAPPEYARTIATGIAAGGGSARVEVVAGAHIATMENPDACAALLLDHLATTTKAG